MDASPWAGRDELLLVRWRLRTTQQTLEHPYALAALRQQGPTMDASPWAGRDELLLVRWVSVLRNKHSNTLTRSRPYGSRALP